MKCLECGNEIESSTLKCPKCGTAHIDLSDARIGDKFYMRIKHCDLYHDIETLWVPCELSGGQLKLERDEQLIAIDSNKIIESIPYEQFFMVKVKFLNRI